MEETKFCETSMAKWFFWYVSSSTIFAVVTNHFRTSYISNIGKCSLVYLESRSAQNMCRKFGRWWDLETLRSEMLASDEASCCHVMSTSLTCGSEESFSLCPAFCPADHWYTLFSSIVMLELMYTHFQQTNTKDSRLMASNLFLMCFSKFYLHMATHV